MTDKRAPARKPRRFSDPLIEKLPHAERGQRYAISDSACPGLRVRVTAKGQKSFLLWRPMPSGTWCTRFLGKFPALTVDEARVKARQWLAVLAEGRDPKVEARAAAQARQDRPTFEKAAEDFIAQKLPSERRGNDIAKHIRKALIPLWKGKAVADVKRADGIALIREKKLAGKLGAANQELTLCKRMFGWFVAQEVYGIETNPFAGIKASALLGSAATSDRTLSDLELRALWIATSEEPYPIQQVYRLLLLTGLRKAEVVDAAISEFDFAAREWIIPAARMKAREHKARPHLVPLTSASLEILGRLPTFSAPHLFSLDGGQKPVWLSQIIKRRIDDRMLAALRDMAVARGEDPAAVTLPHWVNHDLRRTMRTNLSQLRDRRGHKFSTETMEAVLAHAKPGLIGTYDRHDLSQEKFEALEAWAERLDEIVNDRKPANLITLSDARRA